MGVNGFIHKEYIWQSLVGEKKISIFISGNPHIADAQLSAKNIRCLGISTQRATFITWNKKTNAPLHKFITWKDVRSDDLVKQWNKSATMRVRIQNFSAPFDEE